MLIPVSTFILLVLAFGLYQRRNRRIHIPCMLAAFVLDVSLVLIIELNRQAIENVATHLDNTLLVFHVSISLMVLILYGVLTYLGFQILKGKPGVLKWHRLLAYPFLVFRLINYVTSFWVG